MNPADVLVAPVVSEKSYSGLADRKYTFRVHKDAHKTQVRQAIEQLFGVKVASVRIISVPAKPKRRGVHSGVRPGCSASTCCVVGLSNSSSRRTPACDGDHRHDANQHDGGRGDHPADEQRVVEIRWGRRSGGARQGRARDR